MHRFTAAWLCLGVLTVLGCDTSIKDTEATLYPNLSDRSAFRLRKLAVLVSRYREEHNQLPPKLDAIFSRTSATQDSLSLRYDAWMHLVQYTLDSAGYELRSAGPDGKSGTSDDIIVRDSASVDRGEDSVRPHR